MSDTISQAVELLSGKMSEGFDGVVKFVLTGEGSIMLDPGGVRAGDDAADVTLTADADTFRDMLSGDLNATAAFMTGRLTVEGDMGLAMRLAGVLG